MFRKYLLMSAITVLFIITPCMGQSANPAKFQQSEQCPICTDLFGNLTYEGCMIKGNINSKGDRIYHCPLWRDYEKTEITKEKGERWFCTESEAKEAGWRKPKYKTGSCRLIP